MAIYVQLPRAAFEKLVELAKQERRRPQAQASIMLERALTVTEPPTVWHCPSCSATIEVTDG